jgi:alpha-glucosidase (family GH31 glycosyl hydrolase)
MPEPIFYPDSVQARIKEAIALRYRLLPYNYTLTWEAHLQGWPLARPMAFHFPADTALAGREDQYLWGEHLLVAPVLEKGADLRLLQLPEGYWYDYYRGGRPLPGGMPVVQPGPADRIPLLVRAGSWLPEYADNRNAGRWFNDSIAWKLFLPVGEGLVKGRCYVDDGHTPGAYEKEEYALLAPEAEVDARRIQIRMAIQMGSRASSDLLPAPAWSSLEVYGLAEAPRSIQLGGKALPAGNWNWDAGRHILHIRPRGSDLEATITIKR